jgi:hypothetical protein
VFDGFRDRVTMISVRVARVVRVRVRISADGLSQG